MSRFTALLKVSPLPDGVSWVLLETLVYEVGCLGSGFTITVPKGFVTDFASVPRPLWMLIPRQGYHQNAAVVHDLLYWTQSLPRAIADDIFFEAMSTSGVLWSVRHLMYRGVRLGGWLAWWGNKRDKARGFNRVLSTLPSATDPVPPRGIERIFLRLVGARGRAEGGAAPAVAPSPVVLQKVQVLAEESGNAAPAGGNTEVGGGPVPAGSAPGPNPGTGA